MKQTKRNRYQQEWSLKNYLKKHSIPGDPNEIINAFYESRGGNPSFLWPDKIKFCQDHFGLFCQFAQNTYKPQGRPKMNPIIVGEADHISPEVFSQIQERLKPSVVDYNPGSTWKDAIAQIRANGLNVPDIIYGEFKDPVECKCPLNAPCRRDCNLPRRDASMKQIGVITRDRRVFKNFLHVDLGLRSSEGYIQIEYPEQIGGRIFDKVYALQAHWFPGRLELIMALKYRGAEIIYV